ncbi:STAS/SEC14 domain-containing protein [Qipengyuania gelatinilytica]|uniref:STAS/SEC14 domain-containing protein n=1 Tax=Qipengyuania gelatinilytica TaxID=2867231 RepID=A0ABX9A533_9SPHN|nr:STAS/SEC14 domain-containing protein [Qipengyuania gelatinilytica]QZD96398.1 STAS/SEC14 domain-containing protein [Qipengyuania gelatinilytica]
MLTITKPAADRIDIVLDGKVDADIMRKALDDLIEKSEGMTGGKMFYRITNFELPSLGAIGVEFSRLPKLFRMLGAFDKCAVLTDSDWLKKAAELEGALIPGMDIKSFDYDAVDVAEAWLDL